MSEHNIASAAPQRNPMPVTLLSWKPLRRNSLRGFAKVRIGRALILHDVTLHSAEGKRWASVPSKPQLDTSGTALRDDRGKIKYAPVVEWLDREARDAFSEGVIAAVEREHPGATAGDDAAP